MHLPSYPKVYAIGHPAVADLFADSVIVEEKVDGSQFSFMRDKGELFMRSKGADIYADAPEKMFARAVDSVKTISPSLHDGWVYRVEYLQSPKHNALTYDRVPKLHLILYDVNTGMDESYLSRADKELEAARIGLEIVPILHAGRVESADQFEAFLQRESVLGGQRVEGVVAKNYARFGTDKKVLMGKYVREDFKERNKSNWREANPTQGDIIAALSAEMCNPRRWEKAVMHLKERGEIEGSPRDIGKIMAEVKADIGEEERAYIAKRVIDFALPKIQRASTSGLPEWYKAKLLESAFAQTEVQ